MLLWILITGKKLSLAKLTCFCSNKPNGELKLSKDDIFGIQELYSNCAKWSQNFHCLFEVMSVEVRDKIFSQLSLFHTTFEHTSVIFRNDQTHPSCSMSIIFHTQRPCLLAIGLCLFLEGFAAGLINYRLIRSLIPPTCINWHEFSTLLSAFEQTSGQKVIVVLFLKRAAIFWAYDLEFG